MIKLVCFLLFGILLSSAQTFQGKAEYVSKRIFKDGVEEIGVKSNTDAKLKQSYELALKDASEKIFLLTFDKKAALFEKQVSLEKPKPQNGVVSVSIRFSGEGKKYINIADRVKIVEDDILGKDFLIVDTLTSYKWTLIDESKKIGDYICFKAELTLPVTEEEIREYDEYLKNLEKESSLFPKSEPVDKKLVAWYTAEIPVSVGPLNYWGLPGLILEINDGSMMILCSKVILTNKASDKIKIPNSGKEVTQKEFDTIHKEKMDSIMKN